MSRRPTAAAPIETARLRLEPLRAAHADELTTALDDPRLHEFIGGRPLTAPELRERFTRLTAPDALVRGWLNWVLRERQSGQAIGTTQATLSQHEAELAAELAWVIAVAAQGRGYATEAVRAVVTWLQGCGVTVFRAHIHPGHQASIGVATAVGLRPTTVMRDGETRWILRPPGRAR